nr:hypothetical protein [uncultured Methylotenera sp.]
MSLLIKALATAEKDKQKAEKSARSEPADELSLSPLKLELDDAAAAAVVDTATDKAEQLTLTPDKSAFRDVDLSLAEEAGLTSSDIKRKEGTPAKPAATPAKSAAKAKTKADAFNEAARASVANLKAQADVARDSQKAAASVFVANHAVKTASSRTALLLLGVAGALMILLGLQGYKYIQALGASEVVVVTPVPPPTPQVAPVESNIANEPVADTANGQSAEGDAHTDVVEGEEVVAPKVQDSATDVKSELVKPILAKPIEKPTLEKHKLAGKADNEISAGEPAAGDAISAAQQPVVHKSVPVNEGGRRESSAAEPKEPLKLVSKAQAAGVDPTLLAAYEAFSRGDDALAQQKYRQVLQKDVRNVDALLGMAAIAQRQARTMDAIGWYRKVTDIEPRNSIAQSALADLEASTDAVGAESKIKSMLARQPEAANLHAALGNLYAAQNQWAAAQAAYFSASQFAPISADYAFNLAISLEHLGKPKLALVQYQRALDLLNMTGAASPDRAQLEARIRALQ